MKVIVNKLPLKHVVGDYEKNRNEFIKVLYLLSSLSIIFNSYLDILFGIKATLIILLSVLVSKETEILFLSMKSNISRKEAQEAIITTKPEITGLIFALLLPVGTPLFVVAVGSFISIFVGKMVFGGYSFNVFNPAIIGRLFVSMAWPALVTISFPNILDNYLLGLIFQRDLSIEILTPLMELQSNGIVSLNNMDSIFSLLFIPNYGLLCNQPGIIYFLILIYFFIKKIVDLRPILYTTIASIFLIFVIKSGFNLNFSFIQFNLLAGSFLFVIMFMMTDPFTKPFNSYGILIYSVIFTIVFLLIRFLGKDEDGVLNALLFTNLFVPLLNKKCKSFILGLNLRSVITTVVLIISLLGSGLFINNILNQRIENSVIVVDAYVKS